MCIEGEGTSLATGRGQLLQECEGSMRKLQAPNFKHLDREVQSQLSQNVM